MSIVGQQLVEMSCERCRKKINNTRKMGRNLFIRQFDPSKIYHKVIFVIKNIITSRRFIDGFFCSLLK